MWKTSATMTFDFDLSSGMIDIVTGAVQGLGWMVSGDVAWSNE